MKISTGVALSLITVISLRASAQTSDAAFASAFEQAPGAATMARLWGKAQKPAAPAVKPPAAPGDIWAKIVEAVKKDGKFKAGEAPLPSDFTIEEVVGDPKADHTAQTVSFVGEINDDERFAALGAILVTREYKLDPKDGNFHVDQWMIMTDVYGQAISAMHANVVENSAGETVSMTPDKLTPGDPRLKAKFDAMLKHWSERKP